MTVTRTLILCGLLIFSPWLYAVEEEPKDTALIGETLQSLADFLKLQASLQEDIARIRESLKAAESEAEKQVLTEQLEKLQADLRTTRQNFEEIAAGTNLGNLRTLEQQKFNFQEEILSLVEPVVKELKDMTSDVRKKSELREAIARYSEKLPLAEKAIESGISGTMARQATTAPARAARPRRDHAMASARYRPVWYARCSAMFSLRGMNDVLGTRNSAAPRVADQRARPSRPSNRARAKAASRCAPSRPRPTTSMPVIAPPRKAIFRAGCTPSCAAWAVRTLARTDTNMPM